MRERTSRFRHFYLARRAQVEGQIGIGIGIGITVLILSAATAILHMSPPCPPTLNQTRFLLHILGLCVGV